MIPGFNTDIEHNGTTYHVQTEDKGLNSPLILSLIYTGGAILASKRTPYEDLIADGFDEKALVERLERQHKLICAAVRAGRIEDLKKLSDKGQSANHKVAAAVQTPAGNDKEAKAPATPTDEPQIETRPLDAVEVNGEQPPPLITQRPFVAPEASPAPALPPQPLIQQPPNAPAQSVAGHTNNPVNRAAEAKSFAENTLGSLTFDSKLHLGTGPLNMADVNGLHLSLLDEQELRAGEMAVLCVRVGRGAGGADVVPEAEVTVKILGTTFHPIIITQKTNQFGMTVARANLPKFTAGRAAILVRAEYDGKEVMLRRVIQRA